MFSEPGKRSFEGKKEMPQEWYISEKKAGKEGHKVKFGKENAGLQQATEVRESALRKKFE